MYMLCYSHAYHSAGILAALFSSQAIYAINEVDECGLYLLLICLIVFRVHGFRFFLFVCLIPL